MAEYLEQRCCNCPKVNSPSLICPAMVGIKNPGTCICRFVKIYFDIRGWVYFVRPGIGSEEFKVFYRKPGKQSEHGCSVFSWRKSFDEAQSDLNREAKKRGWQEDL